MNFLLPALLLVSLFLCQSPTEALWGKTPEKEHTEKAQDAAYLSAQKAKEAAEMAYEAAKEATIGLGEKVSGTGQAAKETVSSFGEKVMDTTGGAYQSARDTVGSAYEGTKDRLQDTAETIRRKASEMAGMAGDRGEQLREKTGEIYEGGKERLQDSADTIRRKASQMAGMAGERGEQLRGKGGELYEDAREQAEYARRKSQSWLGWFWEKIWDIILFIPRTIRNTLVWSWHTACDTGGDIQGKAGEWRDRASDYAEYARDKLRDTVDDVNPRESVQDQISQTAGHAAKKAREYGESLKERAGQAKDAVYDTGRSMGEKLRQTGAYVTDTGGEDYMEKPRQMGEQIKGKVKGAAHNWLACQAERIFKTVMTLGLLFLLGFLSFLFLASPELSSRVMHFIGSKSAMIRNQAVSIFGRIRNRTRPARTAVPVKHFEGTGTNNKDKLLKEVHEEHEEKEKGPGVVGVEKKKEEHKTRVEEKTRS